MSRGRRYIARLRRVLSNVKWHTAFIMVILAYHMLRKHHAKCNARRDCIMIERHLRGIDYTGDTTVAYRASRHRRKSKVIMLKFRLFYRFWFCSIVAGVSLSHCHYQCHGTPSRGFMGCCQQHAFTDEG